MQRNIIDDKTSWNTIKPFLSDKVTPTQEIILIGNDQIVKNDDGTNEYFHFKHC